MLLRRLFLAALIVSVEAAAQAVDTRILVQSTLTAGLRYHEAKALWHEMAVGDAVALVREPANRADANAVRIEWRGHPLGYLPRKDNEAIARQLDRGAPLQARIAELAKYRNHRLKLGIEIYSRM